MNIFGRDPINRPSADDILSDYTDDREGGPLPTYTPASKTGTSIVRSKSPNSSNSGSKNTKKVER